MTATSRSSSTPIRSSRSWASPPRYSCTPTTSGTGAMRSTGTTSSRWRSRASRSARTRRPTTICGDTRSEDHTSELQSRGHLVCRLLLEKKNYYTGFFGESHDLIFPDRSLFADFLSTHYTDHEPETSFVIALLPFFKLRLLVSFYSGTFH